MRVPYRLDLTANALRRLSTNVVDRFDDGVYRRALSTNAGPAIVRVTQAAPDALEVTASGAPIADEALAAFVRRCLGTEADTSPFLAAAREVPWLDVLATRMLGVKPPRYPSLWEACVNAVTYQQVSIHAASAILRRVIAALGEPIDDRDGELHVFPSAETFLAVESGALRAAGLSLNKIASLRELAAHVVGGTLSAAPYERPATPEVIADLVRYRGIGPWTAAVICLRGLGRLDVFPENDSGVARAMKEISGDVAIDGPAVVSLLGAQRGMLYYHLLLGKLAARGDIAA